MFAKHLSQEIESYAARSISLNDLLERARRGEITLDVILAYLSSLAFIIGQTPVHLERAAQRAREDGREQLASFFDHKNAEETGHDAWAQDDFAELGRLFGAAAAKPVHSSIVEQAHFLERSIEAAPASYLAYILFAEYLTVLLGPTWLTALEERCGIPRSALSVVAKHVELDQAHVEEGLREIDVLISIEDEPALERVLSQSMAAYDAFYKYLYEIHLPVAPVHAAE